jgi:hypothetical protein
MTEIFLIYMSKELLHNYYSSSKNFQWKYDKKRLFDSLKGKVTASNNSLSIILSRSKRIKNIADKYS